jgi:hypothetical protein
MAVSGLLLSVAANRLLYPPDIGSQGNEVVDLENEQKKAVGLVIQRDQFPDNLFAPPRRRTLMANDANPIYDKEMHAELFSQGTLMLRLVIQLSMILAIPLMTVLLFWKPDLAYLYVVYVLVFNILSAPVFTAGAITGERERQTLDLLLTTTISASQILWGKLPDRIFDVPDAPCLHQSRSGPKLDCDDSLCSDLLRRLGLQFGPLALYLDRRPQNQHRPDGLVHHAAGALLPTDRLLFFGLEQRPRKRRPEPPSLRRDQQPNDGRR